MNEACEFLITQWGEGDQINAGKIILENGKLTLHPTKGHENTLKEVRKSKSYIKDKEFDSNKDPEGWLKSLPHQYNGSVLRARLIKDDDENKS